MVQKKILENAKLIDLSGIDISGLEISTEESPQVDKIFNDLRDQIDLVNKNLVRLDVQLKEAEEVQTIVHDVYKELGVRQSKIEKKIKKEQDRMNTADKRLKLVAGNQFLADIPNFWRKIVKEPP